MRPFVWLPLHDDWCAFQKEMRAQTHADGRPQRTREKAAIWPPRTEAANETNPASTMISKAVSKSSPLAWAPQPVALGHGGPSQRMFALVCVLPPSETPLPIETGESPAISQALQGAASPCLSAPNGCRLCRLPSGGQSSRNEGEDGHPPPKCQCPLLTRLSSRRLQAATSPSQATRKCHRSRLCWTPPDPVLGAGVVGCQAHVAPLRCQRAAV